MINFQVADLEVGGATCAMALLLAIKQRSILWGNCNGGVPPGQCEPEYQRGLGLERVDQALYAFSGTYRLDTTSWKEYAGWVNG